MKSLHIIEQMMGSPRLTQYQVLMLQKLTTSVLQQTVFIIDRETYTLKNKLRYRANKISCYMLKIAAKFGCISDMMYIAMYYYETLRFMEALSIIEIIKVKLTQHYVIHRYVDTEMYTEAVGGQSWSTEMYTEAVGGQSWSTEMYTEAVGGQSWSTEMYTEAVGGQSWSTEMYTEAVGGQSWSTEMYTEAVGGQSWSTEMYTEAVGGQSWSTEMYTEAVGGQSWSTEMYTEAVGGQSWSTEMYTEAVGGQSWSTEMYTEAVGGQSWCTKMRKAVALDIRLSNEIHYIRELIPEQQSALQNIKANSSLRIPPFVLLYMLEILCYKHVGTMRAQTALNDLQTLVHCSILIPTISQTKTISQITDSYRNENSENFTLRCLD
ncbi:uncharacterized protein LOC134231929 isoform X2 [Saccostrea cucullata]|uniref:uncharacterized protein LOC134231929 isoform X2 n=1 Tax=Saccostrea cuccullata TaxID=36930 RepID=UPI002ED302AE